MSAAPPPADHALVVVHDKAQAQAAIAYAATHDHPLIVMFSPALALAGGPVLARAMLPRTLPGPVTFALDCGNDPGVALRAVQVGWTHLVTGGTCSLPEDLPVTLWTRDVLFGGGRRVVNLHDDRQPASTLRRVLA
ncbi:MAG: hypothetical protein D6763_04480 [Alphaproteobacteria bacterium]|nr:MAG: hypothetical protein D6763_04480 [Alphaproteobacteria bacterium]